MNAPTVDMGAVVVMLQCLKRPLLDEKWQRLIKVKRLTFILLIKTRSLELKLTLTLGKVLVRDTLPRGIDIGSTKL